MRSPKLLLAALVALVVASGSAQMRITGQPPTLVQQLTETHTSVCTVADTAETDLWTYSLPAGKLNVDGKAVRITVVGTFGATANNKTIKLYFGSSVSDSGAIAQNGTNWRFDATVWRTGAAAQIAQVLRIAGAFQTGTGNSINTPSQDTTAAITIKMTGTNATAAANDVCVRGATVELIGK